MKQFLMKSVLFFSLFCFGVILVNLLKPKKTNPSGFMAAIIDKHARIKIIDKPKIILSGGSNLAFGINSKRLEQEFSIPVVNMGLHAGLGLSFILEELKYSINENDIVFLSIEYFLDVEGQGALKKSTSDTFKEAKLYYTPNYIQDFLEDTLEKFKQLIAINKPKPRSTKSKKVYAREAFNKYGDIIAHLDRSPKELKDRVIYEYRFWEGIELINNFHDFAKKKNVKVFYIFPNFPESEYGKNKEVIAKLELDLREFLEIEIINSPSDFVYPDSYFYDTVYHLNKKGRNQRTKKLIELIKKNQSVLKSMKRIKNIVYSNN